MTRLTLYEPRWHGFARWTLEELAYHTPEIAIASVLESGWVRRPRGASYVQMTEPSSLGNRAGFPSEGGRHG